MASEFAFNSQDDSTCRALKKWHPKNCFPKVENIGSNPPNMPVAVESLKGFLTTNVIILGVVPRYIRVTVGGRNLPNHLGCIKPVLNNSINYQPQLVS